MPNLNGTAENHKDMMNIMRQFLTGYGVISLPVTYSGTGDGAIYKVASPPPGVSEVWTLICTNAGGHGVAAFSVTGSVSGLQTNVCTVGTFYESDGGEIEFVIQDGPADFVLLDQFDITVTQSTWTLGTNEWSTNRYCPAPHDVESSSFDFPNRVFDGNLTTAASKLGVTTGILFAKFEDPVAWDQYTIGALNASFNSGNMIRDWTLEWSDDNVNWTVEDTQAAQVFTVGEVKTYPLTTDRHIYWRLNITANNGGLNIEFSQLGLRQPGQTLDTPSEESLLLQGQGLAGADEIYIGCKIEEDILSPYFNWALAGFTAYESTNSFETQPGVNTPQPKYVSNDAPMEYWLTATGRYVHLTTKVATDFTSMRMGLLLPYSEPQEYSYPLVIMGGSGINRHYTSTDIRHRHAFDPGEDACQLRGPGGNWLVVQNYDNSADIDRVVWPYGGATTNWQILLARLSDAVDGSYELYPLLLAEFDSLSGGSATLDPNTYGEIDGAFMVSGSNNSAENIITVGPNSYIVFQNVFRSEFKDFYAVRLEP